MGLITQKSRTSKDQRIFVPPKIRPGKFVPLEVPLAVKKWPLCEIPRDQNLLQFPAIRGGSLKRKLKQFLDWLKVTVNVI